MLIKNICSVEKDRIWIEIPLKIESDVPFELLIVNRKEVKACFKAMPHLETFLSLSKDQSKHLNAIYSEH